MVWQYHGKSIPLEIYHGVPEGWYAHDIVRLHAQLGGKYDLGGPEATEPGAPSWLPERSQWLQFREMLYRIAEGVLANDPACVEIAVRYIELRHIGSYSGFIRSKLSRRLKHAILTNEQKARLYEHFARLFLSNDRSEEFGDYMRLWKKIGDEASFESLLQQVRRMPDGDSRAAWLVSKVHGVAWQHASLPRPSI